MTGKIIKRDEVKELEGEAEGEIEGKSEGSLEGEWEGTLGGMLEGTTEYKVWCKGETTWKGEGSCDRKSWERREQGTYDGVG